MQQRAMDRKLRKRATKTRVEAPSKKSKRSKEKQQPPKEPEVKLEEPVEPAVDAHETPEQLAEYKRQIDTALALEETINWYRPKDTTSTSCNLDMVLDCNHLSSTELEEYFERYRYLLDGIRKGKIENSRHDKYVRYRNDSDLTWSASTLAFESSQIRALAMLCDKHFRSSKGDYFFKVLIPELCLRIFADEHGMDEAEATKYLMNRPD